MKNGWAFLVALVLFFVGMFSVSSRYQEDVAPTAAPVPQAKAKPKDDSARALSLAGIPAIKVPEEVEKPLVKVILSEEERRKQNEQLSDRRFMAAAASTLKNPVTQFERRDELRRMKAVTYLAVAAHWTENPEREAIFSTIDEAIAQENIATVANERQKKSVAGDKIELFEILLRESPERAAKVEDRARGTWLSPILHYARGRYEFFSKR